MKHLAEAFERFNNLKILVIGDVMVDAYIRGKVSRISPEAPVPIVSLSKRENRLGGAANVAVNLVALGANAQMISVIGRDEAGESLMELMEENNIDASRIVRSNHRKSTIKTRVLGDNQHLLRIDNEDTHPISAEEETALIDAVINSMESGLDAIVFEDYNKGILTQRVIETIVAEAHKRNITTTVDPKKDHFFDYKNVSMFKPNLKELREGLNVEIDMERPDTLEEAVSKLESRLSNQISFITLSEYGVFVKEGAAAHHIPAHLRKIADVSGAGDTVISVATACLAAGLSPVEMAQIANLAGGLVCERSGVVAIEKELLWKEVQRVYNGH